LLSKRPKQGIQKKKRKNNRKRLLSPIELPASLPALQLYAQLFSQSARNMCVFHFFRACPRRLFLPLRPTPSLFFRGPWAPRTTHSNYRQLVLVDIDTDFAIKASSEISHRDLQITRNSKHLRSQKFQANILPEIFSKRVTSCSTNQENYVSNAETWIVTIC